MEDYKKIKTIINRINNICDNEKISLSKALERYNLTPVKYIKLIGLNVNIDLEIENIINEIFNDKESRVYVNPNMQSLKEDCIEISSKTLNKSLSFIDNELRIYESIIKENKEYYYEEVTSIIINNSDYIKYKLDKIIDKEELNKRIISKKYYIKHINIKVYFKINDKENSFEFTINNDMLANDLDYALNLLQNKKVKEAYIIFNKYPSDIKIIGECNNLV